RPPQQIATRAVVATRAPQDPARRLQAAGMPAAASAARASEVRVVQPRQTAHLEASGRGRGFAHEPPPPPASSRERQATMGAQRHASIGSSGAGSGGHTERGLGTPVAPAGAGGRERNHGGRTAPPQHGEHHAARGGAYAYHAPRPPVSHHAMPRQS